MARRTALSLVVVVLLTHAFAAQSRLGSAPTPGTGGRSHSQQTPPPPPGAPSVPQGSPSAPPIGIAQLPSRGVVQTLSPAVGRDAAGRRDVMGNRDVFNSRDVFGSRDVFRAGRFTYTSRYGNRGFVDGGYYGGFYSTYSDGTSVSPEAERRREPPAEIGFLRLDVSPGAGEVYIDGFYVNTVEDFRAASAHAIEAGPHRVEIRTDGYETATFDVRITPNEMTTYRRELKANEPAQARNVTPAVPKTFYVIPKCYAGDKKPSADKLPKGCQALNVREIPPVVKNAR